jgi:hypothetical protein
MSSDEPVRTSASMLTCRHLRSKGMYVYTDASGQPDADGQDEYDSTQYWCFRTMKDCGPDDGMADRQSCCDPSRTCYEET